MTTLEGHWFGLKPEVTPLPDLYWGGRAIYHPFEGVDVLWDRQQFNTTDGAKKDRDALWAWIVDKGLPLLRKELARQRIAARDDVLVTVTDRNHTLIANPKRSYGYLYLGAWRHEATRRKSR